MDDKESCRTNPYIHSLSIRCTNVYPPTTDRASDIYRSCIDHNILNIVDKELNASHITAEYASISAKRQVRCGIQYRWKWKMLVSFAKY